MTIQFWIIVLYICVLFAISIYVKRRAGNSSGFLFAGRKLTTPLVAANIAGTAIGAAATIGVAENAFQSGIAGTWGIAARFKEGVYYGKGFILRSLRSEAHGSQRQV